MKKVTTSTRLLAAALLTGALAVVIGYFVPSIFAALMVFLLPIGIFGYPVMQIYAIRSMRGIWLYLAVAPLIPMAYVYYYTALSLVEGLEQGVVLIMLASPVALIYLLILILAHKTFGLE